MGPGRRAPFAESPMLSRSAAYALRAVLVLAEARADGAPPVSVAALAARLKVPRNYLSKVLHQLAGTGVVTSKRGPGGGFALSLPPSDLTVGQVVAPFESLETRALCVLGRGRCSEDAPCEAHAHWSPVSDATRRFFQRTTLEALLASA